jgi:hypothetical protein
MSMSSKQIQYMMRRPEALMKYQATGQLPRVHKAPSSPLIELLEKLPPRLRAQIRGVRLNPRLGYHTGHQFHTAEQLFHWLRPERELIGNQTTSSESYRDKRFVRRLTLEDLMPFCASWPKPEIWRHFGITPVEDKESRDER